MINLPSLIDPNIAYILLIGGFIMLFLALVTPGTHLLEGGAFLLLFLAGYEVYNLGFNYWGLAILVLSLVPFILAILMLIAGSLYLFRGKGFIPAVHPLAAILVSLFAAGFLWIAVSKGLQAARARPLQDPERLIGQVGQARTEISEIGAVQLASELWSARSASAIPAGSHVRVVRREGFTLIVEPQDQPK